MVLAAFEKVGAFVSAFCRFYFVPFHEQCRHWLFRCRRSMNPYVSENPTDRRLR